MSEAEDENELAERTAALRRAVEDSTAELTRMGIDPASVGLSTAAGSTPAPEPAPDPPAAPDVPAAPDSAQPVRYPAVAALPAGPATAAPAGPVPPADDPIRVPAPTLGGLPDPPSYPPAPYASGTALNRPLDAPPVPPARPGLTQKYEAMHRLAEPSGRLPLPASWQRAVRAITFGLLEPGAAAAVERERALLDRILVRQRSPRTIAFIAGKGGVGTTATAAGIGHTLSALRRDPTVLVDVRSGTQSLGRRLDGRVAASTADLIDDDVSVVPLLLRGGMRVVDSPPWHAPLDPGRLVGVVDALHDHYVFTLLDAGNEQGAAARGVLGRADQVVVVTSASEAAVDATRIALGRVHQVDRTHADRIVVAVVCLTRRAYRRTARRLHHELGLEPAGLVAVPYDPALADGGPFDPNTLKPATREAYLRLAALITDIPAAVPRDTESSGRMIGSGGTR